jgi:hypothetical protein
MPRLRLLFKLCQNVRKVSAASRGVRVIGAQAGLADYQGTLVQSAGAVQVTLISQDGSEVVEAGGGGG